MSRLYLNRADYYDSLVIGSIIFHISTMADLLKRTNNSLVCVFASFNSTDEVDLKGKYGYDYKKNETKHIFLPTLLLRVQI